MLHKFYLLFILFSSLIHAQTYAKVNGIAALVLVPNIGIETPIAEKLTFQVDIAASFWKSANNAPLQFVIITPEIRYHFKENYKGFYIGTHLGGGTFKLQKWSYLYTNYYQKGYNYFIGGTVGYKKSISKKLLLDIFIGGGSQQAFYKGYYLDTNTRYETAEKYNKSGEFLLYRGGIMICYLIY
ncbi:DUF3575 domain-containing protein [Flavobacterium sp.]|uniref:DUF3575 domain-containing protein n=1 Tax=Flavobacterium sp. TaxID=239 RepID=UPI00374CB5E3